MVAIFGWHFSFLVQSVCLVECEGDTIEDFYAMEEKEGGYNPFWDMQEEK